jgi:hypothetical protein
MEVSVWWVVVASFAGVFSGIVLFALMSMAGESAAESLPDAAGPEALR